MGDVLVIQDGWGEAMPATRYLKGRAQILTGLASLLFHGGRRGRFELLESSSYGLN
jgi:hypothetical protein